MVNNLFIIAAGLSSRMGGFPKPLVEIGKGKTLLEHNIKTAIKAGFQTITIALNKELSEANKEKFESIVGRYTEANVVYIESGKGDGHAIIEALKAEMPTNRWAAFAWGDTVFNEKALGECICALDWANTEDESNNLVAIVPVVMEKDPYAWFDLKQDPSNEILKSHFRKDFKETDLDKGIEKAHDQSVFLLDSIKFFNSFSKWQEPILEQGREAKMLDFLSARVSDPAIALILDYESRAFSFNSQEELDNINETLNG